MLDRHQLDAQVTGFPEYILIPSELLRKWLKHLIRKVIFLLEGDNELYHRTKFRSDLAPFSFPTFMTHCFIFMTLSPSIRATKMCCFLHGLLLREVRFSMKKSHLQMSTCYYQVPNRSNCGKGKVHKPDLPLSESDLLKEQKWVELNAGESGALRVEKNTKYKIQYSHSQREKKKKKGQNRQIERIRYRVLSKKTLPDPNQS